MEAEKMARKTPQISVAIAPLSLEWLKRLAHAKGDKVASLVGRWMEERIDTGIRCRDLEKAEELAKQYIPGWEPLPDESEEDELLEVAQSVGLASGEELIEAIARGEVKVSR